MRYLASLVLAVGFCSCTALAQDDHNLQIHGFATQAFVYSGSNNYMGMNTSSGSASWSEAAVNLNDQVTEKLRIGAQVHMTRLGSFGDSNLSVDWALGDYRVNRWVGIRAGKVKIRWGLYNDTQDADPGYLWSLLPEPIYAVDLRETNLSQYGVEVYGKLLLPKKWGGADYSIYYGDYYYASNDGYAALFQAQGLKLVGQPSGKTPGFDLRWKTPAKGLKIGGSLMTYDASGRFTTGTLSQPLAYWPTYYAQYDVKKLSFSYQYTKLVQYTNITLTNSAPAISVSDTRSWFAMASCRVTDKFQLGTYYTHYLLASSPDRSNPANYYRDWAVSSRYDINSYFYAKLEGHFIDGNGVGYYSFNNPNPLTSQSKVVVAKIGFIF